MTATTIRMARCIDCNGWAPESHSHGPTITAWCQECGSGWDADPDEFHDVPVTT